MDYNSILLTLPSLNKKQLEEIRRRAALLIQRRAAARAQPIEDQDWLLAGILNELKARGLANGSEGFRIKRHTSFHSYQTKSEKVRTFLEESTRSLTATEKIALGQICAFELANYINRTGFISLHNLLEHVDLTLIALDQAFPGYISSGMLGVIINQRLE